MQRYVEMDVVDVYRKNMIEKFLIAVIQFLYR